MFSPKQESIMSGSVSAGLLLDRLLLNSMNALALEAVACKIVEDCHHIVANNINRHFSFLQDMVPVVSSKILNSSLTLEQIMESTLENCVKTLLTDIYRDIEKKFDSRIPFPGESGAAFLVNELPGREAFAADMELIMNHCHISKNISGLGRKICEVALDNVIPNLLGVFFNKMSLGAMLWNRITIGDREKHLKKELEKRLRGLFKNTRIELLNLINSAISDFVFKRYENVCRDLMDNTGTPEILSRTA
jgi:hypothetical protein